MSDSDADGLSALVEGWHELTWAALSALGPQGGSGRAGSAAGRVDELARAVVRVTGARAVLVVARRCGAAAEVLGSAGLEGTSVAGPNGAATIGWNGELGLPGALIPDAKTTVWSLPLVTRQSARRRASSTSATGPMPTGAAPVTPHPAGARHRVEGYLHVLWDEGQANDRLKPVLGHVALTLGRVLAHRAAHEWSVAETRQRLSTLLDNLNSGVIVEDDHGTVVEANAAYCRLWALSVQPHALIGQPAASAGRPPLAALRDPAAAWEAFERLKSEGVTRVEQELRLGDGRVFELDFIPFRLPDGHPGYLWIYRDVTARRRAEAEVRHLNQELEARVAMRTQELAHSNQELESSLRRLNETQEQLIHAGKMAAVGGLVAGLSHELNNPLGIIVGYVQGLLRRTPTTSPARESLLAVERQAQRCAHLVRSLLDFSRNKRDPREQIAIAPLIERVIELAAGHARRRCVELRWVAPTPLPTLTACPQEIESALLNLLSNGIDATPPGGSVTLDAVALDEDGRPGIELAVADTGPGIPEHVLPHIFDPFFTTKPVGQGTGIGLSLTRQVVEAHQGRIEVQTRSGEGTTMRLWLPLLADGDSRKDQQASAPPRSDLPPAKPKEGRAS